MSRRSFWIGTASVYAIGFAAALFLFLRQQTGQADAKTALALFGVPIVWGIGPMALALVWLAVKRDLGSARFGLLVFAALYLAIVTLHLWWGSLI